MKAPRARDRLRRAYRWLLAAYPPAFHEAYEADLLQAFDDRRSEPRFQGLIGSVRLGLFLLTDFVLSLRLTRPPRRAPAFHGAKTIMGNVLADLRFSLRMLRKNALFTVAAIGTLALGIGLNAATFSTVRGTLLRPLDGVPDSDELVQIYRTWPGLTYGSVSVPHYQDLRDRSDDVFEDIAAYQFTPMSVSVDERSDRIMALLVSANFFQTYGVSLYRGRPFTPGVEDRSPGAHPVVVLGYGFWRSRFGGDSAILGKSVLIGGQPYEVVGVTPADFRGPVSFADIPLYVPLMMDAQVSGGPSSIEARGSNSLVAVGRLRDGQGIERADARLEAILSALREEYPDDYDEQVGHTLVLQNEAGIHPTMKNAQLGMSAVISAVVGLLLLIACVNVANLFLARACERRREVGIRLSLGASRGRILQQLLTESIVFSAAAGALGVVLAHFTLGLVGRIRPPVDGPWHFDVQMDPTVLTFTVAISVLTGVVFGLVPAAQAAKADTAAAVKEGGDVRAGRSRVINSLVVAQMALSLLLLISAGLFLRSLQGASQIDPGFNDPGHLAMASVDPGLQGYEPARSREFFDRLTQQVSALPGVTGVGMTDSHPLGLGGSDRGVEVPGYDFAEGELRSLLYARVTEGYLETMGVDLVEGRALRREDDENGSPVIVVNQRVAERFWPGESALGKVVRTAGAEREVVGVVETGKYRSLGEPETEFMYLPHRELFATHMSLVARTTRDPAETLAAIRDIVRTLDPDMPVFDVRTMENHLGVALLPARIGGWVLGVFGLLGLVLTAVGIYGVMAYSVAQRKRELGIRVALGADRRRVVRLVLGEGMRLATVGTVLGLLAALGAARFIQGLLYNVSALDPAAFLLVPGLLTLVALAAVYVPARRAAGVDPMRVLKSD